MRSFSLRTRKGAGAPGAVWSPPAGRGARPGVRRCCGGIRRGFGRRRHPGGGDENSINKSIIMKMCVCAYRARGVDVASSGCVGVGEPGGVGRRRGSGTGTGCAPSRRSGRRWLQLVAESWAAVVVVVTVVGGAARCGEGKGGGCHPAHGVAGVGIGGLEQNKEEFELPSIGMRRMDGPLRSTGSSWARRA